MASGPKLPETPLELLENDGTREQPLLSKYFTPTACAVLTFTSVCFANWATKKPAFSGIQKHVLLTTGAAALGKWFDDYRNQYFAEKDAVFRHYIQLHPEDFPAFDRKKYGEVLEPWIPIR